MAPMELEQENLPNASVRQTLQELLECSDYTLELACAKGDNYLGVVWRIRVPPEAKSLVLKLPPQNAIRRKQFFAQPCFRRESLAYEEFLPLTQCFQQERHVPEEHQFRHYAQCLRTRLDEPNECIVLEDLCAAGYRLHDRFAELTPAHATLVIRAYAKLHAISLALKQQQPQRLRPFQQMLDIFAQRRGDHALHVYFEQLKQNALDALRPQEDAQARQRLQAYFNRGSYFDLLLELLSGDNCEPYAVVCHGDSWNNNLLYRQQQTAGGAGGSEEQPQEVCLIDWQLMRYASPVTDLAYFLFSCTTQQFRRQHYKSMLEVYHTELCAQLTRLGEDAEQLLPRVAFEQQLQQKGAVGLLFAMMVLPIVTLRGEDTPDLQKISELIDGGGTTDLHGAGFLGANNETLYKRRMRGVILDSIEYNYI